jgi:hypothetical protein
MVSGRNRSKVKREASKRLAEMVNARKKGIGEELKQLKKDLEDAKDDAERIKRNFEECKIDITDIDSLKELDAHVAWDADLGRAKDTPCAELLDHMKDWYHEYEAALARVELIQEAIKGKKEELKMLEEDPIAYFKQQELALS